jgi:hypothetical protein
MNYKLQFIKISNEHEFAGVGFAGNIYITINALTHLSDGDRLHVDMGTNECACTEPNANLHNTNNCWEYYFDQIQLGDEPFGYMDSLVTANLSYNNREVFMHPENFVGLKNKFFNNFRLKPYLTKLIDDYYQNNLKDKVTLGVQVRLTDMRHHHHVSPIDVYVEKIKSILIERPEITQIFLATDDSTIIPILRSAITTPILCYEDMFRADDTKPHINPYDRFKDGREYHRYYLGIECLQEIFTLSKCDYLLKADISSISIIASMLAENIKQVYKV